MAKEFKVKSRLTVSDDITYEDIQNALLQAFKSLQVKDVAWISTSLIRK